MITKVFKSGNSMALRLPRALGAAEGSMLIEKRDDGWLVKPVPETKWPADFFDKICIEDPAFERPDQGTVRSVEL
ncbi:MAG: hypothetical protein AAF649_01680 [Verrucomicrobiota bacterium]